MGRALGGAPWALMGQAVVGPLGLLRAMPLRAFLGPYGLGPYVPPWVLVGRALMGPWALAGQALVGSPGPSWAGP